MSSAWQNFGDKSCCGANQPANGIDQSIGLSFGLFLGLGFEVAIGLDLNAWNRDLNEIFYDSMKYGE